MRASFVALVALLMLPLIALAEVPKGKGALTGEWEGTWGNAYQNGRMAFVVDAEGKVKGTLTNASAKFDGTMEGEVVNSGAIPAEFTFSYHYPDGDYTGKGQVLLDGEGKWIGIADVSFDGKKLGTIALELKRKSAP